MKQRNRNVAAWIWLAFVFLAIIAAVAGFITMALAQGASGIAGGTIGTPTNNYDFDTSPGTIINGWMSDTDSAEQICAKHVSPLTIPGTVWRAPWKDCEKIQKMFDADTEMKLKTIEKAELDFVHKVATGRATP